MTRRRRPMKTSFVTAVSSIVLALAASPALAAEQHEAPAPAREGELPTMRVDQLEGTDVINEKGETIGDVDEIVRDKQTNELYAVVSVGGFLGIGEHDVAIPLRDMTKVGSKLAAPPGTTKEQLEQMPEYQKGRYVELPDDQVVTVGSGTKR
jgi:sporulation protein YlmC with PRC-barrel domain